MGMDINEDRIKDNLSLFSFPRLSGTIHEKKAFELAKTKMEDLGHDPIIQPFEFSTFYSRVYPKITFPLVFWIILVLFLDINLTFILVNLVVVILIYLPFFLLTRNPENIKIGKCLSSQNLYTIIKAREKEDDNIANVFFMAHLDSKGQLFTARIRFLSIFTWIVSFIIIIILLIIRSIISSQVYLSFNIIMIAFLAINLSVVLILGFNVVNNKSKGVVDDASGISCVLELLTYFSAAENHIPKVNMWFILTGAEESGTMGIRFFHKFLENVDPKNTIVYNFESLGKSLAVFISNNTLNNQNGYYLRFRNLAEQYGHNSYVSPISRGIHTDGIYLFRKGYNLFEYGSPEVGKFMHSKHDSLLNVDTSLLKQICKFVIKTLEDLIK
jgi:hypothetical protein